MESKHRYLRAGDLFRALFLASPREVAQVREKLGVPPAQMRQGSGSYGLAALGPEDGDQALRIPHAHHSQPEPSAL